MGRSRMESGKEGVEEKEIENGSVRLEWVTSSMTLVNLVSVL